MSRVTVTAEHVQAGDKRLDAFSRALRDAGYAGAEVGPDVTHYDGPDGVIWLTNSLGVSGIVRNHYFEGAPLHPCLLVVRDGHLWLYHEAASAEGAEPVQPRNAASRDTSRRRTNS